MNCKSAFVFFLVFVLGIGIVACSDDDDGGTASSSSLSSVSTGSGNSSVSSVSSSESSAPVDDKYLFDDSGFESGVSAVTASGGISVTQAIGGANVGNGSLHVTGTSAANADGFSVAVLNTPKSGSTKLRIDIKGTATGKSICFRFKDGTTQDAGFNLGDGTTTTLTHSTAPSYGSGFTIANWTVYEYEFPTGYDFGSRTLEVRHGEGGVYDYYIDQIIFL
ncbi:MAG TPA: hypothetical protein PK297_12370 [Spirochaetota bacterium]|nr:hypothetical protein [Spirochaetota bacterium]